MPLSSARFRGNPRLEAIAAGDVAQYLHVNDQGDAVRAVQEALIDYGGHDIQDGATGYFGQQTAQAVVSFKQRYALTPSDPVVGIDTIGKLDERYAIPYADRSEWLEQYARPFPNLNFSRFKEQARRQQGQLFTFNPIGVQLPIDMDSAFLTGLEALLNPNGSPDGMFAAPATWGVSPFDLYHVHLNAENTPGSDWDALRRQYAEISIHPTKQRLMQQADLSGAPRLSPAWTAAYSVALLAPVDAAGNTLNTLIAQWLAQLLAESRRSGTLRFIWHTFENPSGKWRPNGMQSSDQRRHWWNDIAPLPSAVTHAPAQGWTDLGQFAFLIENNTQVTIAGTDAQEPAALLGVSMQEIQAVE